MLETEFKVKVADCNCVEFNSDIKVELRVIKVWTSEIKEIWIWRNLKLQKYEVEEILSLRNLKLKIFEAEEI